jgi:hypothetical protein
VAGARPALASDSSSSGEVAGSRPGGGLGLALSRRFEVGGAPAAGPREIRARLSPCAHKIGEAPPAGTPLLGVYRLASVGLATAPAAMASVASPATAAVTAPATGAAVAVPAAWT